MGLAAGLVGWAALAAVAGGCGYHSSTDLTITVNAFRSKAVYQLRCDPPAGDLPRAAAVCEALAAHRDLFFDPPPNRGTCFGGPGIPPDISIEGHYRDDEVQVAGRSCDWPDGLGFGVIQAAHAYRRHPSYPRGFDQAVARLHCGEDPNLLVPTAPWHSVSACLRDPAG